MHQTDIAIVGAGVIGLAVSSQIAKHQRTVYVLEKNNSFGQETSSRNSEVIHAGIYYPANTLKAKTCVVGRRMLYEICRRHNIPCKKLGKLIVACDQKELKQLERLLQAGRHNGVEGLRMLSAKELQALEPNVRALAAIHSPETGIVDSHQLMRYFFQKAKAQGAEFAFNAKVRAIKKNHQGYLVTICDADGADFSFLARVLINCAGLNSDQLAELAGIEIDRAGYRLYFCKGEYFRVHGETSRLINRLVYPVPETEQRSLGIHATPDLGGGLRLGPDAEYIAKDQANYNVQESKKADFSHSVNNFLPFIKTSDLIADTAGIRPKLQGPQDGFRDFVICDEQKRGLPGFVNLIG
ncbi:MAG: NAD(P)/FAD-dependent oxidoreductase, partial [Candidatus Omnitrophica bacterium]|nr:NAD(P)/FAD-dependent oxidoreductase [Candidatus Omnitrophota bacterium]